ncbi:hypothetical protein BJX68DRAFT_276452 [Aspergillus pseudodeflectus]|uniref:Uncharacterized protein n=1 Tax=Aspergillus pseudodeflectus TaxID=176178 RepID=A0ABR4K5J3_9EURO
MNPNIHNNIDPPELDNPSPNKHIRCEPSRSSDDACERCCKDQVPCTRTKSRIRFSDVSGKIAGQSSSGREAFSGSASRGTPRRLVYIDETPELMVVHGRDAEPALEIPGTGVGSEGTHYGERMPFETIGTLSSPAGQPPAFTADTPIRLEAAHGVEDGDGRHIPPNIPIPTATASVASITRSVMAGLVKPPQSLSTTHNTLEFLLFRYYIDHLSTWLDFCDPDRHFQMVVPQRARRCPPLMNAILAASARHLTRVPKKRTESGAVQYDGRILHDLTDETALHYHNKCIHDLLTLGANPEQTRNEDLLAAGIILRFYEEVDYPLQDDERDSELFLRVINIFIEAQIPNVPLSPGRSLSIPGSTVASAELEIAAETYSSPNSLPNTASIENKRWYMADLRQAAFWVAFRQEVYSAFLKQRPFNMSLSRCDVFRSFAPAEDALWTARLVIFCADVLEFCYGNSHQPPAHEVDGTSAKDRWAHLKSLEQKWVDLLPSSFEPIYFREPDKSKGEVFPELCYLTNLHIAGVQHVELARILLAVYNPNIPRLGLGHRAAMRALSEELRGCVLRLCGIAVHNRKNPPSLTTALLGIVVCGEHFENRAEQQALLGLLDELEYDLGWPVGNSRDRLKQSWGW